jgi:hypothetical protein
VLRRWFRGDNSARRNAAHSLLIVLSTSFASPRTRNNANKYNRSNKDGHDSGRYAK